MCVCMYSIVKWFLELSKKILLLFFAEFELLTFHNLEKLNKWTLLKSASKFPTLPISA